MENQKKLEAWSKIEKISELKDFGDSYKHANRIKLCKGIISVEDYDKIVQHWNKTFINLVKNVIENKEVKLPNYE